MIKIGYLFCDRFDPERFAQPPAEYVYEPYGFAGNRRCPGVALSQIILRAILTLIFSKFEVGTAHNAYI